MNNRYFCAIAFFIVASLHVYALERSELSPDAQKLVPDGKFVVIELENNRSLSGIVTFESDEKIVLRIQRKGGIASSRTIMRSDIKNMTAGDISSMLAERLLEIEIGVKGKGTREEYKKAIELYAEFVDKCQNA
ncbi:MAG: hypothetical protein JXN60_08090, partial [Lentisphaerae bacterium]|nr:hypothetical protein [Lentisphaerota bacterium]